MKPKTIFFIVILLLFIQLSTTVYAEEEDSEDLKIFDLEAEKLLNLGSSLLAAMLFVLTISAHTQTQNKRYLFIAIAFLLFAVKGFLMGSEIFFGEWHWVDPVTGILDFVILATFFAGIMKK